MKKVNKTSHTLANPNPLTVYDTAHPYVPGDKPTKLWNQFKDHNASRDYQQTKVQAFQDQGDLCAYCEIRIDPALKAKQELEHFHPKSSTHPAPVSGASCWALDWENILGTCLGGADIDQKAYQQQHPHLYTKQQQQDAVISCGARKADTLLTGVIFDPRDLPAFPVLVTFNRSNGKLESDQGHCQLFDQTKGWAVGTTFRLMNNTIIELNLNSDRLCQNRLAVSYEFDRQLTRARQTQNRQIHTQLATYWFQQKWPSFFTTRRLLLGSHAETWLQQNHYNG